MHPMVLVELALQRSVWAEAPSRGDMISRWTLRLGAWCGVVAKARFASDEIQVRCIVLSSWTCAISSTF